MPERFNITGHMGGGNLTCRGGEAGRSWLGSIDENLVQVNVRALATAKSSTSRSAPRISPRSCG
jgi:hypothetical protein